MVAPLIVRFVSSLLNVRQRDPDSPVGGRFIKTVQCGLGSAREIPGGKFFRRGQPPFYLTRINNIAFLHPSPYYTFRPHHSEGKQGIL